MPATPSNMIPLGTQAPDFALTDYNGRKYTLADFSSYKALVVMFICNHCPFVVHVRSKLVEIAREYSKKGVAFVAINSNDFANYPEDSPAKMSEYAQKYGYSFPYLVDDTQAVAKAYDAACTPDFYLFDSNRKLAYRGQMDDSRPNNGIEVTGNDLIAAMDAVLGGKLVSSDQKPSIGCNIKWKAK